LKYKIEILKGTNAQGASGAVSVVWKTLYNTMADVEYNTGNKGEQNNETFSSQSIKIKIRHKAGIDETLRVKMEGRVYKIAFVNPLVFRRVLQLSLELVNE
jgi:SPP1 family predicted phage head-tail adaptor